jgi:acetyltransferase-like isoleucine patch superfamily enzyme
LKNVIIGNNTKISRDVILYSPEPDLPVVIGNFIWISHGVYGEGTGGRIFINDHSVIAHFTTMLTSSGPGSRSPVMESFFPTQLGDVFIGIHSWVGANSILLPGVILTEGVVIGSNSLVRGGKYDAYTIYAGSPAKFIRALDKFKVEEVKKKLNLTGGHE